MVEATKDVEMEETIHFFLWVSHGSNTSQENVYQITQLPFKQIVMYSNPFKSLYPDDIEYIALHNPCDFLIGSCPILPFKDKDERKTYVFLPTLLYNFRTIDKGNIDIENFSGLYYIPMKKCKSNLSKIDTERAKYKKTLIVAQQQGYTSTPEQQAVINNPDYTKKEIIYGENITNPDDFGMFANKDEFFQRKIFNWQQLFETYNEGYLAYAQIFDLVKRVCTKKLRPPPPLGESGWHEPTPTSLFASIPTIDINNVVLGIASCQDRINTDGIETLTLSSILANIIQRTKHQSVIYDPSEHSDESPWIPIGSLFSKNIIPLPNKIDDQSWSSLYNMRRQGCGLNVLTFLKFMERKYANEQITCLPDTGTSMEEIIDYIDEYLTNQTNSPNYNSNYNLYEHDVEGYVIYRLPVLEGVTDIYRFMMNFSIPNQVNVVPYAIIVKLYKSLWKNESTKQKFEFGHAIIFYKNEHNQIMMIDPQQSLILTDESEIKTFVEQWNFIDIILSIKPSFELERPNFNITTLQEDANHVIIIPKKETVKMRYRGGGKKTKMYKKKKITRAKRKINKKKLYSRKDYRIKKSRKNHIHYKCGIRKKIQYGGETDYQKIIKELDIKYNTPSVIVTDKITIDPNIEDVVIQ